MESERINNEPHRARKLMDVVEFVQLFCGELGNKFLLKLNRLCGLIIFCLKTVPMS